MDKKAIYKQPENEQAFYAHEYPTTRSILVNTPLVAEIAIEQTLMLPESADERLDYEQKAVIDIQQRQAQRSHKKRPLIIKTVIRMEKNNPQLQFETHIDNQIKDHRLRVLFPTAIQAKTHFADSIYEVVERPNEPNLLTWKNPENPQHQHAFVSIYENKIGVTIGNYGLNEYEVLKDNTLAITLLRCVGELGDWGYFPTPEAQCLGKHVMKYSFESVSNKKEHYQSMLRAQQNQMIVSK